jgi:hypothetical protein
MIGRVATRRDIIDGIERRLAALRATDNPVEVLRLAEEIRLFSASLLHNVRREKRGR